MLTTAELLRNGITTFVEFGSQPRIQAALARQCGALGLRGYLGPGYCSGHWVSDERGRLELHMDEPAGELGFEAALASMAWYGIVNWIDHRFVFWR